MGRQAGRLCNRSPSRRVCVLMLGLLLSWSAIATGRGALISRTVAELDPLATSLSVDFGADAETGRAWAEITEHSGDREAMPSIRQVEVTGLYFDVNEAAVVMQAGDDRAVCARQEVRGGWLLRRQTLVPTGDCHWQVEPRDQAFDNGFAVAADRGINLLLLGWPRSSE